MYLAEQEDHGRHEAGDFWYVFRPDTSRGGPRRCEEIPIWMKDLYVSIYIYILECLAMFMPIFLFDWCIVG